MIQRCIQLLRSCRDPKLLSQIHANLLVSGATSDDLSLARLVISYSSLHGPDIARAVFDSSPNPTSPVLWNSIIRAYTRARRHSEALAIYHSMSDRNLAPDKHTFTFVLKACTGASDPQLGLSIHRQIKRRGLESDVFIGTALVDMYCKLGRIRTAREVFDRMPVKDVVAWNALIAGLEGFEALEAFKEMQLIGFSPNSVTVLNLFPAIGGVSAVLYCRAVHGFAVRRCFSGFVANGLIDAYSKCGDLSVARRVFDGLVNKDKVSWGTMISGYTQNGFFFDALELFEELRREDVEMNQVSVVSAICSAAEMRDFERGADIHAYTVRVGIDSDVSVATTLVSMYAKFGDIEKAKRVFDGIHDRDSVAWSAMISAFVQTGHPREAVALFQDMRCLGINADQVSIASLLSACAESSALDLGKSMHCHALKSNISSSFSTGTAIVAMYAKCGCFDAALTVFDDVSDKDIVTWNALINAYAQMGDADNAMKMFRKLQSTDHRPDSGTIVGVLPACALTNDLEQGVRIHGQVIKSGFESDRHVKNALIDMYAKCRNIDASESLFYRSDFARDEISWNTMIVGYQHNGCAEDAIKAFCRMKAENIRPSLVTLVSVLPATAHMSALREGMALHAHAVKIGFESSRLVGNSLVDMYSKCGRLDFAERLFDWMLERDTVSWNVMLNGYAIHGRGEEAVSLFSRMRRNHAAIDLVSFIAVLSACRHGGLIEEGKQVFDLMKSEYRLKPDLEHYACLVDLLGRAGRFNEAMEFIQTMPVEADAGVWGALLGGCGMHSNVRLGEVALDRLVSLEPLNSTNHVTLSSIYAQVGRWSDARRTRSGERGRGLVRVPGCSWVNVESAVHGFGMDHSCHQTEASD
ncbi:Pentatricopeptide repeat-containing protein [Acorus gramineus]|uniref:Pentatricopeptide repeat-containing protein n=1 Tax=Acorus gramineus TaxID=55184 RepID=A0AAV9B716_ACOGR|nr:Pentatricopeptide repeat-containing protein [Acorus gramineus]